MAVGNSDGVNIKRVSNLSNQNPLVSIEEDKPLAEALKLFKQSRTQRIVVIKPSESSNQFVGVLSQVMRFCTVDNIFAIISSEHNRVISDVKVWCAADPETRSRSLA